MASMSTEDVLSHFYESERRLHERMHKAEDICELLLQHLGLVLDSVHESHKLSPTKILRPKCKECGK